MDPANEEKITFITIQGLYCYKVMPFGLKNVGATYKRTMTTLFHDMINKEMEVYVDDMIVKSHHKEDHMSHLHKLFVHLRKYRLKLNPEQVHLWSLSWGIARLYHQ